MGIARVFRPWVLIWFHPQKTLKRLVELSPSKGLFWLSALYGIPLLLSFIETIRISTDVEIFPSPITTFIATVVIGWVFGYFAICTMTGLFFSVGKWIGGKGDFDGLRAAFAWSSVPQIFSLLGWIVLFYDSENWLFIATASINLIMSIWSSILFIGAIAAVQRFSILKAIVNYIIVGFFFLIFSSLLAFGR